MNGCALEVTRDGDKVRFHHDADGKTLGVLKNAQGQRPCRMEPSLHMKIPYGHQLALEMSSAYLHQMLGLKQTEIMNMREEDLENIGEPENWKIIQERVRRYELAIRGSNSTSFSGGDGYNLSGDNYTSYVAWIKAVLASLNFAQDAGAKYVLLLRECALKTGETYRDSQGLVTLPKCNGLGSSARVVAYRDLGGRTDDTADWLSNYIAQHDFDTD